MASKGVDEGKHSWHYSFVLSLPIASVAEAIVISRYNETRHLRTQAALSKLSANVAQNLEAM